MTNETDTAEVDETLSALVDDELGPAERRRVVDCLIEDEALRQRWSRYHAGRAALEGAGPGALGADFSDRVRAAVEDEPTILAPHRWQGESSRWLRPAAGFAVAATVALMMLGGLTLLRDRGLDTSPPVIADGGDEPVAAGNIQPVAIADTMGPNLGPAERERVHRRLGMYLSSHNEFAGRRMPSVMPYSRLVGLNASQ